MTQQEIVNKLNDTFIHTGVEFRDYQNDRISIHAGNEYFCANGVILTDRSVELVRSKMDLLGYKVKGFYGGNLNYFYYEEKASQ